MSKSIIQKNTNECYLTHSTVNLDKHHIFPGVAYRHKSEQDGLWVMLNHNIHMYIHQTHEGHEKLDELKKIAQKKYEETHTREEFRKRYGKSYL